ncbi:MAG: ABC transporter substrate-binding protein [Planctomycetota bacterium]
MQNHFGLKDFFLFTLVIAVGVLVFMSMIADDRRFEDVQTLTTKIDQQAKTLAQVRREVETLRGEGLSVRTITPGAGPAARDESWARPGGVPVTWPAPFGPINDPNNEEDFNEGGELIEIFEGQPPIVTPFRYSDVYGRRVVEHMVVESLARYNPQSLELDGLLAEAWQYDPDGMWLRAKINNRARFSDGEPVTAEDFRWTFHELVFNQEIEAARFRAVYDPIEKVEAISERVVEFTFKQPMFLNLRTALQLPVVPRHVYEKFTPSQINQATGLLIGSGPYMFETLDPDNQWAPPTDIVLVRNENYWGHRPAVQRLRFTVVTDNVARLTEFENGNGHIVRGTHEQYRRKTADERFMRDNTAHAWVNMRSGVSFIAWNCAERGNRLTPFADPRVRLAMTLLLDRNHMRLNFAEGLGEVASSPFSPIGGQTDPSIEPWPYDLDRARELLAEAGWIDRDGDEILENEAGEDFIFEFTYSTGSSMGKKTGAYLKDQCRKVGVICELRTVEWAIYDQLLDQRNFDAITLQWSHSDPEGDPYQVWHSDSIANEGDNFSQWANDEADRLIEQGRATMDAEERRKIWFELHRVIHEDQPYTFILNPPWVRFVSREVGNFREYPAGLEKTEMFMRAPMN